MHISGACLLHVLLLSGTHNLSSYQPSWTWISHFLKPVRLSHLLLGILSHGPEILQVKSWVNPRAQFVCLLVFLISGFTDRCCLFFNILKSLIYIYFFNSPHVYGWSLPLSKFLAAFWGCYKKMPQTKWFKQQKSIDSQFWRLEVWTQGAGRAFWRY